MIFYQQFFIFSKNGEIIFEEENCLDVSNSNPGSLIDILKCHGFKGNQQWRHEKSDVSLIYFCNKSVVDTFMMLFYGNLSYSFSGNYEF